MAPAIHRPIGLLLGVAVVTTLAIVAVVAATRPQAGIDAIAKGQPVPNVAGTTLDGQPFDLAALRGRPVVINFWGPSCVPCQTSSRCSRRRPRSTPPTASWSSGSSPTIRPRRPGRSPPSMAGRGRPSIDPGAAIKAAYRVIARPQTYFVDRSGILRSIQIGEVREADFERQYGLISGSS